MDMHQAAQHKRATGAYEAIEKENIGAYLNGSVECAAALMRIYNDESDARIYDFCLTFLAWLRRYEPQRTDRAMTRAGLTSATRQVVRGTATSEAVVVRALERGVQAVQNRPNFSLRDDARVALLSALPATRPAPDKLLERKVVEVRLEDQEQLSALATRSLMQSVAFLTAIVVRQFGAPIAGVLERLPRLSEGFELQ